MVEGEQLLPRILQGPGNSALSWGDHGGEHGQLVFPWLVLRDALVRPHRSQRGGMRMARGRGAGGNGDHMGRVAGGGACRGRGGDLADRAVGTAGGDTASHGRQEGGMTTHCQQRGGRK